MTPCGVRPERALWTRFIQESLSQYSRLGANTQVSGQNLLIFFEMMVCFEGQQKSACCLLSKRRCRWSKRTVRFPEGSHPGSRLSARRGVRSIAAPADPRRGRRRPGNLCSGPGAARGTASQSHPLTLPLDTSHAEVTNSTTVNTLSSEGGMGEMLCSRPYPFLSRLKAAHSGRKALWPNKGPADYHSSSSEDLLRERFAVRAIHALWLRPQLRRGNPHSAWYRCSSGALRPSSG